MRSPTPTRIVKAIAIARIAAARIAKGFMKITKTMIVTNVITGAGPTIIAEEPIVKAGIARTRLIMIAKARVIGRRPSHSRLMVQDYAKLRRAAKDLR